MLYSLQSLIEVLDCILLCFSLFIKSLDDHLVHKPKSSLGRVRHERSPLYLNGAGGMMEVDSNTTMGLHVAEKQEVNETVCFMIVLVGGDLDFLDRYSNIVNGDNGCPINSSEARPCNLDI